jgi:hypothetical protein
MHDSLDASALVLAESRLRQQMAAESAVEGRGAGLLFLDSAAEELGMRRRHGGEALTQRAVPLLAAAARAAASALKKGDCPADVLAAAARCLAEAGQLGASLQVGQPLDISFVYA